MERQRNARVVLQGTNGNKDSTAVDRKKLADMVAVMKRLTVIKPFCAWRQSFTLS